MELISFQSLPSVELPEGTAFLSLSDELVPEEGGRVHCVERKREKSFAMRQ
jgi:hypothetical protein